MKVGLLGGTFDPIHEGHLYLGRKALEIFGLDQVQFMVAHVPPHKRGDRVTREWHRFSMTALATLDEPRLLASDWELWQPGPSYTINTLCSLRRLHPDNEYCFIAGGDSLKEIHLWKEYDRLLSEHCFVFMRRDGIDADLASLDISDSLRKRIQVVCEKERPSIQPGKSFWVLADPPAIRSTEIRETFAAGKSPAAGLVSHRVLTYIQKYRLYEQTERRTGQGLRSHQQQER